MPKNIAEEKKKRKEEAAAKVAKTVASSAQNVNKSVQHAVKPVQQQQKQAQQAQTKPKQATQNTGQRVSNVVRSASNTVKTTANQQKKAVQSSSQAYVNRINNTAKATAQTTQRNTENVRATARKAAAPNRVANTAKEMAEVTRIMTNKNPDYRTGEMQRRRNIKADQEAEYEATRDKYGTGKGQWTGEWTSEEIDRRKRINKRLGTVAKNTPLENLASYDIALTNPMSDEEREYMRQFLSDEELNRIDYYNNQRLDKRMAQRDKLQAETQEAMQNAESDLERWTLQGVQSGEGMAMDQLFNLAIPGGWTVSMGARTIGSQRGVRRKQINDSLYQSAIEGGMTEQEAMDYVNRVGVTEEEDLNYAKAQAVKEIFTEYIFQGIGLGRELTGGRSFFNISKYLPKGFLAQLAGGALEENAEEWIGMVLDPFTEEYTYERNLRNRQATYTLEREAAAYTNAMNDPATAQAASLRLNSGEFLSEQVAYYKDMGFSDEEAEDLAEKTRDYINAEMTGDVERAEALKKELSEDIRDIGGLKADDIAPWSEKNRQELLDTTMSTSILTLATGLPSSVTTYQRGVGIQKAIKNEGIRKWTMDIINGTDTNDTKLITEAQSIKDRIENGKSVSPTQIYNFSVKWAETIQARKEGADTANDTAKTTINEEGLESPSVFTPDENGDLTIVHNQATNEAVQNATQRATEIIERQMKEAETVEGHKPFEQVTALETAQVLGRFTESGLVTASDSKVVDYGNVDSRRAFEEMTGINLSQYTVLNEDGTVNIPKTNEATHKAFYAMAAQNQIEAARRETEYRKDQIDGEIKNTMRPNMGAAGNEMLTDALQSIDSRDLNQRDLVATTVNTLYHIGRSTNEKKEDVLKMFSHIDVDESIKARAFEAGQWDWAEASVEGRNQIVEAGQPMEETSRSPIERGTLTTAFTDEATSVSGTALSVYEGLAKATNLNIVLRDDLWSETVDKDGNVKKSPNNGMYQKSTHTITLNIHADAQQNISYVVMHEMTHHIKAFAPAEYQALEDLIFNKWMKISPKQVKQSIENMMEAYEVAKHPITESEAREEIVCNAMAEAMQDKNFANKVCQTNTTLGKAILNSIRDALRNLRDLFISQDYHQRKNEAYHGALLSQLGILEQAERLWLDGLTAAYQNQAEKAFNAWHENAIQATETEGDEVFSILWGNARWTDDRIDHLIKEYGSDIDENYSDGYAVLMRPRDYLKLTVSTSNLNRWNESARNVPEEIKEMRYEDAYRYVKNKAKETGEWIHDNENYPLDEEELRSERQTPFLIIEESAPVGASDLRDSDGAFRIVGHEGRHRMRALMEQGVRSVPVVIIDRSEQHSKNHQESMELASQDFGSGPVNFNAHVTVRDMVPIKPSNRDELIEKFGVHGKGRNTADIKYSITPQQDADYMAAVESGDMETAQRMVDMAAKAAGYDVKAYHGTTEEFNKFSRAKWGINHDNYMEYGAGFYFTPNENEAKRWAERGRNGRYSDKTAKVMSVYLSQRKALDADQNVSGGEKYLRGLGVSEFDAGFIANRGYRFINYLIEDKGFSNVEVQDTLKALGYDSVELVYKTSNTGQYVVFDPEQVKSADPVTYDDAGNIIPLSERFDSGEKDIRYSVQSGANALGLTFQKRGEKSVLIDADGNEIEKVTREMVINSPLGFVLSQSARREILPTSVLSNEYRKEMYDEVDFVVDVMNMILNTQDIDMIYAVSGTIGYDPTRIIDENTPMEYLREKGSRFIHIRSNSETQYGTTVDFTTICVKTQAVIDAMSAVMKKRHDGLTKEEVINIVYEEVYNAGEQVPCPVCYVFSRWVGLGSIFDTMRNLQRDFPETMTKAEIQKEFDVVVRKVDKLIRDSETSDKTLKGTEARNAYYKQVQDRINELDQIEFYAGIEQLKDKYEFTDELKEEREVLKRELELLDAWSWLINTRLKDSYKPVPLDILYDINAGKEFAENYPDSWKFRTTRGAGMGKAAVPYTPAILGNTIMGINTGGKVDTSKRGSGVFTDLKKNPFLNPYTEKNAKSIRSRMASAIKKVRVQNLMNGQRLQSTSDFRFEYALDYLLNFLEFSALGAKAQLYSKVPEAIPFLASVGTECNCSVMALGNGIEENRKVGDHYIGYVYEYNEETKKVERKEVETDQPYSLVFSDVTGMAIEDAVLMSSLYDNVQPILVGIGKDHIVTAMASDYITMIIPYHSSGNTLERYRKMMEIVGEAVEARDDFAAYENEHAIKDATPEQLLNRDIRTKILTGKYFVKKKFIKPTEEEANALQKNEYLRQLFIRFYGKDELGNDARPDEKFVENYDADGRDADCYHTFLTSAQAGVLMPHEYWDKTSTIEDADKQGAAYVEYCNAIGYHPVFSGWDANGRFHEDMDFTKYPGYWKVLIDRCMYNNDGTYHKQQAIRVNNARLDMINPSVAREQVTKPLQVNDPTKTAGIAERVEERVEAKRAVEAEEQRRKDVEAQKKKQEKWLKQTGVYIDSNAQPLVPDESVRRSIANTDNAGAYLSDGQLEFFKDSKATDRSGHLAVAFHTTDSAGFTIFDPNYTDDKRSLFFTSNRRMSDSYTEATTRNPRNVYPKAGKEFDDTTDRYHFVEDLPELDIDTLEKFNRIEVYNREGNLFMTGDSFTRTAWELLDYLPEDVEVDEYDREQLEDAVWDWDASDAAYDLYQKLEDAGFKFMFELADFNGTYACYLNLVNPLIIEGRGQNWNDIVDGGSKIGNVDRVRISNEYRYQLDGDAKRAQELKGKLELTFIDSKDNETTFDVNIKNADKRIAKLVMEHYGITDVNFGESVANRLTKIIGYNSSMSISIGAGDLRSMAGEVGYTTREWARMADEQGYDGVIFRDIYDYGGGLLSGEEYEPGDVFVAFKPDQAKSVFNENPTENPDINLSAADNGDILAWLAETASPDELADLPSDDPAIEEGRVRRFRAKEDFFNSIQSKWKPQWKTDHQVFKAESVEPKVRQLIMSTMKNADTTRKYKKELVDAGIIAARRMYRQMVNDDLRAARDIAWEYAESVVDDVEFIDDSKYVEYKALRDYLRHTKIHIEPVDLFGVDITGIRRKNLSRMIISTTDGTSIDHVYNDELVANYPEYFSSDINTPADQLQKISDVLDSLQPYRMALDEQDTENLKGTIAEAMWNIVERGEEYKSLSDRYQEQIDAQSKKAKLAYQRAQRLAKELWLANERTADERNQRERLEGEVERERQTKEKYGEELWLANEQSEKERTRLEGEVKRERRAKERFGRGWWLANERTEEAKQKHREYKKKVRDNNARLKSYGRIEENYKWLVQRTLDPTKEKNVPDEFRTSLAEMLEMFDFQTERSKKREEETGHVAKKTFKMREMRDRLNDFAKGYEGDTGATLESLDANMDAIMKSLAERLDGKPIDALEVEDIIAIDKLLAFTRHIMDNYNKVRIANKTAEISVVGGNVVLGMLDIAEKRGLGKEYGGLKEMANIIINMEEVTPIYFFEKLGAMNDMYKQLRNVGFDKYVRNTKMINERMEEICGPFKKTDKKGKSTVPGSELDSWRNDKHAQTFELERGGKVMLSPAQMMSLYCLSRRPQAMGHILKGGISVTPIQVSSKIEERKQKWSGRSGSNQTAVLTEADVKKIIAALTPEQVKVADQLQDFMVKEIADLGNEAHMEMYGYKNFTDPNYFPIKVSGEVLKTDVNNIGDVVQKVKSFGAAKPVTPGANNQLVIDDIFSVVADHCNGMNLYNAYLVPISDFMRVYNYKHELKDGTVKTVKEAIKMAYTDKALTYIENFMKDINGIKPTKRGGMDNIMDNALGKAKTAAVFGNIRVFLQQPTAIVRAFAVMDPKYFKGAAPSKAAMQEMFEHCPIAYWKSQGNYEMFMGRDIEDVMMNNWSMSDKLLSDWYGVADNKTWSWIWSAVKNEVKEGHPDVKEGSEEFWELCNERMSYVVDKTQVVDSAFHRSNLMRNKQVYAKLLTAFQAEPTLTFNVLRDGIVRAREAWKAGNKANAGKIIARVTAVLMLQQLTVSIAQAVADAWRGKHPKLPWEDDEDLLDQMKKDQLIAYAAEHGIEIDSKAKKDEILATIQAAENSPGFRGMVERYIDRMNRNVVANFFENGRYWNNVYGLKELTPLMDYAMTKLTEETESETVKWIAYIMGWDQETLYTPNNILLSNWVNMAKGFGKIMDEAHNDEPEGGVYERYYDPLQKFSSGIAAITGLPVPTLMRDTKPIWDKIHDSMLVSAMDEAMPELSVPEMPVERPSGTSDSSGTSSASESSGTSASSESTGTAGTSTTQSKKSKSSKKTSTAGGDTRADEKLYEKRQRQMNELKDREAKALEKTSGLSGVQKSEKLYDIVTEGYTKAVDRGDYEYIDEMRSFLKANGGDVAKFDEQVLKETKTAYKRSLSSRKNEQGQYEIPVHQRLLRSYMLDHGMTEADVSDLLYHSYMAKDLKAAFRLNNEEYIMNELVPLVHAGLTYEDLQKLYKYRFRYQNYNGKYASESISTGKFVWPVTGPITSDYGYRGDIGLGTNPTHYGIDIGGNDIGTPVGAADGGQVTFVGWNGGFGNQVVIRHDDGTETMYSHLSGYTVNVGDNVAQGQEIGQIGSTGQSTGPHLDFRVKVNGEYVNPMEYLKS